VKKAHTPLVAPALSARPPHRDSGHIRRILEESDQEVGEFFRKIENDPPKMPYRQPRGARKQTNRPPSDRP
jgi:hypothetical protein